MYLPEIPSDNLYKFCAFSGLFLIVFFIVYPNIQVQEYQTELSKLQYDSLAIEIQIKNDFLNDTLSLDELVYRSDDGSIIENSLAMQQRMKKIEKHSADPSYREQQKFLAEYYPLLADNVIYMDNRKERTIKMNTVNRLLRKNLLLIALLDHKKRLITMKIGHVKFVKRCGYFGITCGLLLIVTGIYYWYIKIQKPKDIRLQKDSLQP